MIPVRSPTAPHPVNPARPRPLPAPRPNPPRPVNPRPRFAFLLLAAAAASTAMGVTLLVVVASRINGAQAVAGAWNVVLLLSLFWLHFLTSRLTKATQ